MKVRIQQMPLSQPFHLRFLGLTAIFAVYALPCPCLGRMTMRNIVRRNGKGE
jgi:hypothetical protein